MENIIQMNEVGPLPQLLIQSQSERKLKIFQFTEDNSITR